MSKSSFEKFVKMCRLDFFAEGRILKILVDSISNYELPCKLNAAIDKATILNDYERDWKGEVGPIRGHRERRRERRHPGPCRSWRRRASRTRKTTVMDLSVPRNPSPRPSGSSTTSQPDLVSPQTSRPPHPTFSTTSTRPPPAWLARSRPPADRSASSSGAGASEAASSGHASGLWRPFECSGKGATLCENKDCLTCYPPLSRLMHHFPDLTTSIPLTEILDAFAFCGCALCIWLNERSPEWFEKVSARSFVTWHRDTLDLFKDSCWCAYCVAQWEERKKARQAAGSPTPPPMPPEPPSTPARPPPPPTPAPPEAADNLAEAREEVVDVTGGDDRLVTEMFCVCVFVLLTESSFTSAATSTMSATRGSLASVTRARAAPPPARAPASWRSP